MSLAPCACIVGIALGREPVQAETGIINLRRVLSRHITAEEI